MNKLKLRISVLRHAAALVRDLADYFDSSAEVLVGQQPQREIPLPSKESVQAIEEKLREARERREKDAPFEKKMDAVPEAPAETAPAVEHRGWSSEPVPVKMKTKDRRRVESPRAGEPDFLCAIPREKAKRPLGKRLSAVLEGISASSLFGNGAPGRGFSPRKDPLNLGGPWPDVGGWSEYRSADGAAMTGRDDVVADAE